MKSKEKESGNIATHTLMIFNHARFTNIHSTNIAKLISNITLFTFTNTHV